VPARVLMGEKSRIFLPVRELGLQTVLNASYRNHHTMPGINLLKLHMNDFDISVS